MTEKDTRLSSAADTLSPNAALVTARRRNESLIQVPIAVTAMLASIQTIITRNVPAGYSPSATATWRLSRSAVGVHRGSPMSGSRASTPRTAIVQRTTAETPSVEPGFARSTAREER